MEHKKTVKRVTVSIEKKAVIGEIGENLMGSFLEHVGRAIYTGIYEENHITADEHGFRGDVLNLVRELQVPIVRYPGGNFVSGYRWQDGIGAKDQRPKRLELAWRAIENNQVGIDEFSCWAQKAGCDVIPTVNMGTGTAQDAADFVEYCNFPGGSYWSDIRIKNGVAEPYRYKYWCVGNEMDGNWQICHMPAAEYGRKANEAIKMMKWVDPTIQVTVAGSSALEMPTFAEWDRIVLEHTYEMTDYLSLHRYYGFLPGRDDTSDYLHAYLNLDDFIASLIATADYVKAYKRSKKVMMLSIDEWNIWHQHQHTAEDYGWTSAAPILENHYDVKDALLFSGLMMTLINRADRVKIGCMAQLVNVIAPILTQVGGGVLKQTIFYPYLVGCRYIKGKALHSQVTGSLIETAYGDAAPVYTAAALDEASGELTVFLLNPDPEAAEVSLSLAQFGTLTQIEHLCFGSQDLEQKNTFENPNAVVMHQLEKERPYQNEEKILLDAYSFHVIRYQEALK